MHLYFLLRGIKRDADDFITQLQGQYLPMMFKWPGKKELEKVNTQTQVRPIQLFEVVFPEEHRDIMLMTILGPKQGITQHRWHDKIIGMIRGFLKIEKIPDYPADTKVLPVAFCKQNIEVVGIGVKKDYWVTKDGKHVADKEEGAYEGL